VPKGILFVQSNPSSPDREDEYNKWYSTVHIPDVCAVPGVTGASRFRLSDATPVGPDVPRYSAVYELEADDLKDVIGEIASRAMDGRMNMSDAMAMDPVPSMVIYELMD
jgi:hypothetical protein